MKHFQKRFCSALLFCIFLLSGPAAFAQTSENKTLKVGFFELDGYHMMDEDGQRSGYGYEYLQKIALYTHWSYEYVGYEKSWADMQQMLLDGEIDLVTSAQKTPYRLEQFGFSSYAIGACSTVFTVKSGNSCFCIEDISSLDGIRVGMIKGSNCNDSFAAWAQRQGFTYTSTFFETSQEVKDALQAGDQIDAAVTSNLRTIENEWILAEFDPSPVYIIVNKNNTELLKQIDFALSQLNLYHPGLPSDLSKKYYSAQNGDSIFFTSAESDLLTQLKRDNKAIRILLDPELAPISSYSEKEGWTGIVPQLLERMLKERVDISYTIIPSTSRTEYLDTLQKKDYDVLGAARVDFNEAEKSNFRLTSPYLSLNLCRVTKNGFSGFYRTVATVQHGAFLPCITNRLNENQTLVLFDSYAECIDALQKDEVQCVYMYNYCAQKYVNEDVRNTLRTTFLPDSPIEICFAVPQDADPILSSILDKAISTMPQDEINAIVIKETEPKPAEVTFIAYFYRNPGLVLTAIALAGLLTIISIIAIYRTRHARFIQERANELSQFISYSRHANDCILEIDLENKKEYLYTVSDEGTPQRKPVKYVSPQQLMSRVHPDDCATILPLVREEALRYFISQNGEIHFECRVTMPDNNYHWFDCTAQGMRKDAAHPCNIILFWRNIDRLKQDEELRHQALTDALFAAQQASEAKSNFLSKMSHEIRTPLNGVIGYLNIAKMSSGDFEKVQSCLKKCETAAKQLLEILNDILDISSIESGKMKIASESFDLKKLLGDLSHLYYSLAAQKNISFKMEITGLTEEWVIGDHLRVNQILLNLLANALKFTPSGGSIVVSVRQLSIASGTVMFQFKVTDSGVGMSAQMLNRLFTPFEQESASVASKYGGTGLGLSICKNLVSLMNGRISAESEPDKGSCFTVTLPFKQSFETDRQQPSGPCDFSSIRALVIDDEENSCEYMTLLLNRCGVYCDSVTSGEKALRQIKRRKGTSFSYDLCLLDLNMPGMDGLETAKAIRSECGVQVPIIIATAYDFSGIADEARAAGVNQIMSKPLFQSSMFNLLMKTFGNYNFAHKAQLQDRSDIAGMNILLAEDNEMNMDIAVDILQKAGVRVVCAANGTDALSIFCDSAPGTFDAVLMDVQMPVMDGYKATKAIRSSRHPEAKTVPIIAMTANAFAEDVTQALACGMNDHLSKPIIYEKLFAVLARYKKGGFDIHA